MTGKPIAKDDFDEYGVDYVDSARTFAEATQKFDEICMKCHICRGDTVCCGGCPIRATLLSNIEQDWYVMKTDDYLWYNLERSSVDD